jgi:ketosteroid isomerase-like protein
VAFIIDTNGTRPERSFGHDTPADLREGATIATASAHGILSTRAGDDVPDDVPPANRHNKLTSRPAFRSRVGMCRLAGQTDFLAGTRCNIGKHAGRLGPLHDASIQKKCLLALRWFFTAGVPFPGGNDMSEQDNVRTVQRIYEAFGRGDVSAIVDTLADRFEWHHRGAPDVPWGKSRNTKADVTSFFHELNEAVEVLGFEAQKYVAQDDQVVALGTFRARSKKTGREFEEPWAMAWTFKDGKVVGYRAYEDTGMVAAALR